MLTDLRRATQYEVQVRARTLAGYGSFSPATIFRTLPDGKKTLLLYIIPFLLLIYLFFLVLNDKILICLINLRLMKKVLLLSVSLPHVSVFVDIFSDSFQLVFLH